jgi:Bacterial regulatory proteins, tetR family
MIMTSSVTGSRQPSKNPCTKPGEQRRRNLLNAGLTVFGRRGVHATTLDEITREAGVAKSTFYLPSTSMTSNSPQSNCSAHYTAPSKTDTTKE